MKKKLFIIFLLSIIILIPITFLIINLNKDEDYDKLSSIKFSNILINCDTSTNLTIDEAIDNNPLKVYKIDNNKYLVKETPTEEKNIIYYEEESKILYKYYYENGKWLRKIEVGENPCRLNLKLANYKDFYESFEFDKKTNEYYLSSYNENIKDIKLIFKSDNLYSYEFINSNIKYKYVFTYYNNTTVTLPLKYSDVYEKKDESGWDKILNATADLTNFTATSIIEQKKKDEVISSSAFIYKINDNKSYISEINSSQVTEYYKKISNDNEIIYKKSGTNWIEEESKIANINRYNQAQLLPIEFLRLNYDKLVYNEFASSYLLENITYNDYIYKKVSVLVDNDIITYIYFEYVNLSIDNEVYITEIIDFYDFSTTTIDIEV